MTREELAKARAAVVRFFKKARVVMTPRERERIEIADFGLAEFQRTGLALLVYVNNDRYCAKELALLPRQTCPEHRHPDVAGRPGKMETFRLRWGKVYLYVEGEPAPTSQNAKDCAGAPPHLKAKIPRGSESYYTVFHEIELNPGDQYTIPPNTLHWFQGGEKGAVISEFSGASRDELDVFTDPRIRRIPSLSFPLAPPRGEGAGLPAVALAKAGEGRLGGSPKSERHPSGPEGRGRREKKKRLAEN